MKKRIFAKFILQEKTSKFSLELFSQAPMTSYKNFWTCLWRHTKQGQTRNFPIILIETTGLSASSEGVDNSLYLYRLAS